MRSLLFVALFGSMLAANAGEVTVAVAANFATTAGELARVFEARTGHHVRLVSGSTGRLYAQAVNGAPFDVLLAADAERPRRLEAGGQARAGSRRTYAVGKLVAWSRDPALAGRDCLEALRDADAGRIALANPELAPYGAAAREYLERAGLWESLRAHAVLGENVSQTLQFAASGGARIGFVAASQITTPALPAASCVSAVPEDMHAPIEQQAVILVHAGENMAAAEFFEWLLAPEAQSIVEDAGYRRPEGT